MASLLREHTADTLAPASVHAFAEVSEIAPGSWSIELRLRTEPAQETTRVFRVASCEAGAQVVALALAIAIAPEDPVASTDTGDDPAIPSVPLPDADAGDIDADADTVAPATEPPGPEPTRVGAEPAPPRRDVRAVIGAAGGVTGGILPRLGGLLVGHVGVIGRRFRVVARFEHEIRHEFELRARPEAVGRVAVFGAAVEGGPTFQAGPLEIPVTAGVAAAAMRAEGVGAPRNEDHTVPWVGMLVGTGFLWAPIPRVAVGLQAELVAGLVRHTFRFAPTFELFSTGWVGGRGLALVEVRLP